MLLLSMQLTTPRAARRPRSARLLPPRSDSAKRRLDRVVALPDSRAAIAEAAGDERLLQVNVLEVGASCFQP
jgi:hypothetical protein